MNAESKVPVCYVVDREPGLRRLVSSALESFKIDVKLFDTLSDMMGAPWTCEPDLVFLDVTVGGSEGVEMIDRLAETGAKYPIQILSGLNPVLVEQIRRQGERSGLRVLPVLAKPLQSGSIRQVVAALGIRRDSGASIRVDLREVLAEGWLELWYQPTIDLKMRKMVGAEAFVRARHPEHGILIRQNRHACRAFDQRTDRRAKQTVDLRHYVGTEVGCTELARLDAGDRRRRSGPQHPACEQGAHRPRQPPAFAQKLWRAAFGSDGLPDEEPNARRLAGEVGLSPTALRGPIK